MYGITRTDIQTFVDALRRHGSKHPNHSTLFLRNDTFNLSTFSSELFINSKGPDFHQLPLFYIVFVKNSWPTSIRRLIKCKFCDTATLPNNFSKSFVNFFVLSFIAVLTSFFRYSFKKEFGK